MSRIETRTRMSINLHSSTRGKPTLHRAIQRLQRAGGSSYRSFGPVTPRIIMVTDGVLTEEAMAVDEKEPRNNRKKIWP